MDIFRYVKRVAPDIPTKTGMILGMGETKEEVVAVMRDLRDVDVDILTLGQYLRPSEAHITLDRYYTPQEFRELYEIGMEMGSPRRIRTARSVQLSRVGAGPGSRRMSTETKRPVSQKTKDGRRAQQQRR
jgi:lipoate synthase